MKKLKLFGLLALAVLLAFGMFSCGDDDDSSGTTTDNDTFTDAKFFSVLDGEDVVTWITKSAQKSSLPTSGQYYYVTYIPDENDDIGVILSQGTVEFFNDYALFKNEAGEIFPGNINGGNISVIIVTDDGRNVIVNTIIKEEVAPCECSSTNNGYCHDNDGKASDIGCLWDGTPEKGKCKCTCICVIEDCGHWTCKYWDFDESGVLTQGDTIEHNLKLSEELAAEDYVCKHKWACEGDSHTLDSHAYQVSGTGCGDETHLLCKGFHTECPVSDEGGLGCGTSTPAFLCDPTSGDHSALWGDKGCANDLHRKCNTDMASLLTADKHAAAECETADHFKCVDTAKHTTRCVAGAKGCNLLQCDSDYSLTASDHVVACTGCQKAPCHDDYDTTAANHNACTFCTADPVMPNRPCMDGYAAGDHGNTVCNA